MIIACLSCGAAIRVIGDSKDAYSLIGEGSDFWPNKYPCFRCGKIACGLYEAEITQEAYSALKFTDLSAEECFLALNGMGTPEERNCVAEVIEPLFAEHGVKVSGRQHPGQMRYYIDSLTFKDGTKLYLAPGPNGATVYRVSKPHSYVESNGND